jgi:hypothetical protein
MNAMKAMKKKTAMKAMKEDIKAADYTGMKAMKENIVVKAMKDKKPKIKPGYEVHEVGCGGGLQQFYLRLKPKLQITAHYGKAWHELCLKTGEWDAGLP